MNEIKKTNGIHKMRMETTSANLPQNSGARARVDVGTTGSASHLKENQR
jgi:hypothetical protein